MGRERVGRLLAGIPYRPGSRRDCGYTEQHCEHSHDSCVLQSCTGQQRGWVRILPISTLTDTGAAWTAAAYVGDYLEYTSGPAVDSGSRLQRTLLTH